MIDFLSKKTRLSKQTIKVVLIVFALIIAVLLFYFKKYLDEQARNIVVTPPEEVSFDTIVPFPDPPPGSVEIGGTKISISLFMGTEVDLSTVIVETTPFIELTPNILQDNPERVVLTPTTEWQAGTTYVITVKKGIISEVTGRESQEDLFLEYQVQESELIPTSEDFHPLL